MPNIDTYLQNIKNAVYGEEVRGSIHDAIQAINNEVDDSEQVALKRSIASTYSSSSSYAVGDYVFYPGSETDGVLYKCIVNIPTGEAWNSRHWVAVELTEDVSDLKGSLSDDVADLVAASNALCIFPSITHFGNKQDGKFISINTGEVVDIEGYTAQIDYAPVLPKTAYYLKSSSQVYGAWYGQNKNFLSKVQIDTATGVEITVTSPSGAAFVRLSCPTADWQNLLFRTNDIVGDSKVIRNSLLHVTDANYSTMLPTLSAAPLNSILLLSMSSSVHQTDYPIEAAYYTSQLITVGYDNNKIQFFLPVSVESTRAKRRYLNGSWQDWEYEPGASRTFAYGANTIDYTSYETLLPLLGSAELNSIYTITMSENAHQSDYPTDLGYGTYTLITIGQSGYREQYLFAESIAGNAAKRRYYSNFWHEWEYRFSRQGQVCYKSESIDYNNYGTLLPLLGSAELNSIYTMTMSSASHQSDYPTDLGYGTYTLITIGKQIYREQYVLTASLSGGSAKRRFYSNSWHEWEYSSKQRSRVAIGTGEQYESLSEGLIAAYAVGDCDVVVRKGTYDMVSELQAMYGNDYFSDENFSSYGINIGKGNVYYFEPGSEVRCILPASASEAAQNKFSPFMSGIGDYDIIGLRVYSEFCRYCVHDEMGGTGIYKHTYKDCYMHHNDTGAGYVQCIGGGLGANGLIDIDGCVFESDTAEQTDDGIVSWHNGYADNIQSFINIRNCYFVNGYIRFSWYGTSELISKMNISGCSFKNRVYEERAETAGSTVRNTSVKAWCNEVRSQ